MQAGPAAAATAAGVAVAEAEAVAAALAGAAAAAIAAAAVDAAPVAAAAAAPAAAAAAVAVTVAAAPAAVATAGTGGGVSSSRWQHLTWALWRTAVCCGLQLAGGGWLKMIAATTCTVPHAHHYPVLIILGCSSSIPVLTGNCDLAHWQRTGGRNLLDTRRSTCRGIWTGF